MSFYFSFNFTELVEVKNSSRKKRKEKEEENSVAIIQKENNQMSFRYIFF